MTNTAFPRLGAACGAIFPVALFLAAGDGSQSFSAPRAVEGVAAITLFIPFLAYLYSILRTAEGENGWLSTTALLSGVSWTVLKVSSIGPELATHRAHLAAGTSLYQGLHSIGDALTLLSLYPLTLVSAAVAVVALRTHVLPRWLGVGAAVSTVALAANAGAIDTESVPGLLVFLLWTLLASIVLFRRAWRSQAHVSRALVESGQPA